MWGPFFCITKTIEMVKGKKVVRFFVSQWLNTVHSSLQDPDTTYSKHIVSSYLTRVSTYSISTAGYWHFAFHSLGNLGLITVERSINVRWWNDLCDQPAVCGPKEEIRPIVSIIQRESSESHSHSQPLKSLSKFSNHYSKKVKN